MIDRLEIAKSHTHNKNLIAQRQRNKFKDALERYFSSHNVITVAVIFIFLLITSPLTVFVIVNKVNYSKFTYNNIDELKSGEDVMLVFATDFDRKIDSFPSDIVIKNLSLIYKKIDTVNIIIVVNNTSDSATISTLLSKYKIPIEKVTFKKYSSIVETCKDLKQEKTIDSVLFTSTINISDRIFYSCKNQGYLVYGFLPHTDDTYVGSTFDRISQTYFDFLELNVGI